MSLLPTIGAVDQDTGFYNGVATTSYRNIPTQTLTRDYGASPTSTKIMSFGGWVKRQQTGHYSNLLSATLGGGGIGQGYIWIGGNSISVDQIAVQDLTAGGATTFNYITNRLVRDTSAWMHLWVRIDTTDSTEGDRVQLWINGVRETSFATATAPSLNADTVGLNQNKTHFFGHSDSGYGGHVYYSDWWWLDGSAVTPVDTVGEFKNGVFIPKNYSSPSFGNKGWHLKFDQTGVGSPSDTTIGADSSGNSRHWTSTVNTNVEAHDCAMPDSPENNFCTLNPLYNIVYSPGTLSEGNLRYDNSAWNQIASTFAFSSGKWYFEVRADSYNSSAEALAVGIREAGRRAYNTYWHHSSWDNSLDGYVYGVNINGTTEYKITGASETSIESSAPEIVANSVIGIAIDLDSSTTSIKYNVDGGTLFTLFEDMEALTYHPAINGYQAQATVNFGQDSSFAGQETATSNSDANGNGTFHSAVPSGYLALCSANLSEPTISPNANTQADDHFNTVLYSGDGQTTQNVTGVGFQPDWTWIKERSSSSGHVLADSSRGYDKYLASNETIDEGTGVLNSVLSDGFQTTNSGATNQSSQTYVAWNWKANGGTTSSNTDGSITSTVQANTTAGFSIVTYTGTDSATETVGHGLGSVPAMFIVKSRDSSSDWAVYHKGADATAPEDFNFRLNDTVNRQNSANFWNDTAPTSSVFTIGTTNLVNNTDDFITYCFAEIEGYSKFGSFVGNGNADGAMIFTSFKPAFLIIKRQSGTANNWHLWDTTRGTFNPMGSGSLLIPDDVYYESQLGSVLDILSNGFKARANSNGYNGSGVSYIYMAFAEVPFKYSLAR